MLLSCAAEKLSEINAIAVKYGIAAELIGETTADRLEIAIDDRAVVSAAVWELRSAWGQALEQALHVETEERLVPATLQKS